MRRMLIGRAAVSGLVLAVGISLAPPATPQTVEHKPRMPSHTAMEHEMNRLRTDIAALREAMKRVRTLCRAERQAALKPHLQRVRGDMDRMLAMEERMQADVARGRMVSDHELRSRIQILGGSVRMLIEMNALALDEAERPDCRKP